MSRKRWILVFSVALALGGCSYGPWNSGDRVLVAKCLYESKVKPPERFDVVVFKYPDGPVKRHVPTNYIKRLLGLPGEVLAIFFGNLFRMNPEGPVPGVPGPEVQAHDLWRPTSQPSPDPFRKYVRDAWEARQFEIVRKPPSVALAMRRIVFDNNHQAEDLKVLRPRWWPRDGSGWTTSPDRRTLLFGAKAGAVAPGDVDWVTYQHLIRPDGDGPIAGNLKIKPQLITDFMGYNAFNFHNDFNRNRASVNWAGSLMLEANLEIKDSKGSFRMELNRGADRFQARFDLASGACALVRIAEDGKETTLQEGPTSLRGPGARFVRFANFDARLTLWVDRDMPFGDGVAYDPLELGAGEKVTLEKIQARCGPRANDLERPASLGAADAAVEVTNLRLWRDTVYTMDVNHADVTSLTAERLADPREWDAFQRLEPKAFYVQPRHYLCLGDNSTHSSDSRYFGLVPERLMLGRALAVYWPLERAGRIR